MAPDDQIEDENDYPDDWTLQPAPEVPTYTRRVTATEIRFRNATLEREAARKIRPQWDRYVAELLGPLLDRMKEHMK